MNQPIMISVIRSISLALWATIWTHLVGSEESHDVAHVGTYDSNYVALMGKDEEVVYQSQKELWNHCPPRIHVPKVGMPNGSKGPN